MSRGITHDDALRNTRDTIVFPKGSRIKKMVRRLLKGRQHQNAVLHFCNSESGDA